MSAKTFDDSTIEEALKLASNSGSVPMGIVEMTLKKENFNNKGEFTNKFSPFKLYDEDFVFKE